MPVDQLLFDFMPGADMKCNTGLCRHGDGFE